MRPFRGRRDVARPSAPTLRPFVAARLERASSPSMESLENGYRAVVIGARGGIGAAVAAALEADPRCGGVSTLARGDGALPFDVTSEASVAAAAARLKGEVGEIDLVFIATGALTINGRGPEKSFKELDPEVMQAAFAINALGPALAIKHFAPLLARRRRSAIAALSARVGSIGDNRLGGWTSYRASKAALNQILRCAAIELSRTHPKAVCAALHPGTVATALTAPYVGDRPVATPQAAADRLLSVLDGLGGSDSGGFFAYDGSAIDW